MKKILPLFAFVILAVSNAFAENTKPAVGDGTSDNPYQITTANEFMWFGEQVNNGNNTICCKLMNDVDMGTNQIFVGTTGHSYGGTFDGNDHTITINYTLSEQYDGLFGNVSGATIKHLRVAGTVNTSAKYTGGMIGLASNASIICCTSSVTINSSYDGEANIGGFIGLMILQCHIKACIFNGSLLGEKTKKSGGFVGYTSTVDMTNCLFQPSQITFIKNTCATFAMCDNPENLSVPGCCFISACGQTQGTEIYTTDLANGKACFKLNDGVENGTQYWYQNIGSDDTPCWDNAHGTVYGNGDQCPSIKLYSNYTHDFEVSYDENGIGSGSCVTTSCEASRENLCEPCVYYAPTNSYMIANRGNLISFARMVNGGLNTINGEITNNIDMADSLVMIGTEKFPYKGTFYGGNYTVKVNYTVKEDVAALFRYISGATISYVRTSGIINTSERYAAGVVGECESSTIKCCASNIDIESSYNSQAAGGVSAYHAGIVAHITAQTPVNDCLFFGQMNGSTTNGCSGIVGLSDVWVGISNCLVAPTKITIATSDSHTFYHAKGFGNVYNSYYSMAIGNTAFGILTNKEEMKSGALCLKLNKGASYGALSWYQSLKLEQDGFDADTIPVFNQKHGIVYTGVNACKYSPYSNSTHIWTTGTNEGYGKCFTCSADICQPPVYDYDVSAFNITNKGNLEWLINNVAQGYTGCNAKLKAALNLSGTNLMIGTSDNPYSGNFDGCGHTIKVGYDTSENYTALFRYVYDAKISNLFTEGTINTSAKFAAGLVANFFSYSDESCTIKNCVSTVDINSTVDGDGTHGGLIGHIRNTDDAYESHWRGTIKDCAFYGSFTGHKTSNWGGLIGYSDCIIILNKDLFSPSSIDFEINTNGCATLARIKSTYIPDTKITNCYYTQEFGTTQGTSAPASDITDGTMAKTLSWTQDTKLNKPLPFVRTDVGGETDINIVEGVKGSNTTLSNSSVGANGKFLVNGHLIIKSNGKEYNTAGQQVNVTR